MDKKHLTKVFKEWILMILQLFSVYPDGIGSFANSSRALTNIFVLYPGIFSSVANIPLALTNIFCFVSGV